MRDFSLDSLEDVFLKLCKTDHASKRALAKTKVGNTYKQPGTMPSKNGELTSQSNGAYKRRVYEAGQTTECTEIDTTKKSDHLKNLAYFSIVSTNIRLI